MNKTACEKTMDVFLELDKDEGLPFKTTLHLITCKKCRTLVRLCSIAQRSSSRPLHIPEAVNNTTITSIIQKVNPDIDLLKDSHTKPVSLKGWIFSGSTILSCLLLFTIFTSYTASSSLVLFGDILLASLLCLFCAFFVGSNIDFFIKKFDTYSQHRT